MNWRSMFFGTVSVVVLVSSAYGAQDESFLLEATAKDFGHYFPGYLANGYLSTLPSPRGTEGNLAYMVAFMDYSTEDVSRPAAIPGWTEIDYTTGKSAAGQFWLNQSTLNDTTLQDYHQILNLYDATLTTSYRYVDHERSTNIEVTTFVSQSSPHMAAMQITLKPDFDGVAELTFGLNSWAPTQPRLPLRTMTGEEMQEAVAAHNMKLVAVAPATADRAPVWYHGDTRVLAREGDVQDLTLWLKGKAEQGLTMSEAAAVSLPIGLAPIDVQLRQSPYRLALNVRYRVRKGETYSFGKFVAISRDGWGGDAAADVALARDARNAGFDKLLGEHRSAWHGLWRSDIVIDGDLKAQQAVHSDLYYLLSTSTVDTSWPMGACGLTTGYLGHAFWDSDSWIFPAMLLLHPERAKSLVMFRAHTLSVAQSRARARGLPGAMYPWEADPEYGTEEIPHFASVLGEREIHVNADIAIAQWQYWLATHDKAWLRESGWPVIRSLAQFWVSRASYNPDKHRYEIAHVTSVEENFTDIPNDTFTNASVRKVLGIASRAAVMVGELPDPAWHRIAQKLYLPFSEENQHYLDFDESVPHHIEPWGSAVLALLSYPSLDLKMTRQIRRNDYDHAMQPIEEAQEEPSTMGLPPLSIAAATVGDVAGTTKWLTHNFSSALFKPPFNVRTETPDNNTGYFVTASAGFIQNILFGLSGLRIGESGLEAAYEPILPPLWGALRFTDLSFRGLHYSFTIERDAGGKARMRRRLLK